MPEAPEALATVMARERAGRGEGSAWRPTGPLGAVEFAVAMVRARAGRGEASAWRPTGPVVVGGDALALADAVWEADVVVHAAGTATAAFDYRANVASGRRFGRRARESFFSGDDVVLGFYQFLCCMV